MHLWPIRPALMPGELLSSWLARVAATYSTTVKDLVKWPSAALKSNGWFDFDRTANDGLRDYLAESSALGRTAIDGASLGAYEGIVFEKLVHGTWGQWIVPRSMSEGGGTCHTGQPYCPDCLSADPIPYFRRAWRLAFYTVCPIHGRFLIDQCWKCKCPVDILAPGTVSTPCRGALHWHCAACGVSLVDATFDRPDSAAEGVGTLASILRQFESGAVRLSPALTFDRTAHFFDGLRQIASLLFRPRSRDPILAALASDGIDVAIDVMGEKANAFEAASCAYRRESMRLIMLLLEDWPHRFVKTMRDAGLTSFRLAIDKKPGSLPYWLETVIEAEFRRRRYLTEEEVLRAQAHLRESGRDVSRIGVKRMLGVTESGMVNDLVPIKRDRFTITETRQFFREFDRQIRFASAARGHRMSLARDRTVVLMVAFGVDSLDVAVSWTLDMFPQIAQLCRRAAFDPRKPPAVFGTEGIDDPSVHLAWYFNFVLDQWNSRKPGEPVWVFPSRNRAPVHMESVKIRAGQIKAAANLGHLASCVQGLTLPAAARSLLRENITESEASDTFSRR